MLFSCSDIEFCAVVVIVNPPEASCFYFQGTLFLPCRALPGSATKKASSACCTEAIVKLFASAVAATSFLSASGLCNPDKARYSPLVFSPRQ
jgi:hypothetical protein